MKETTIECIDQHLDKLKLSKDVKNLVIHSSLISFGKLKCSVEDIFTLIKSKIDQNATILVPTFSLKLTENDIFTCSSTPSQGMGMLAEYVRTLPRSIRANNPMHSYAGIGPESHILTYAAENLSFGQNSCFEKLLELKPHLLLLGCPFHHGATHIHQVEAELEVPYREWLNLKRTVSDNDTETHNIINFMYYGIKSGTEVKWSPKNVLDHLKKNDKVTEATAPYGKSYLLQMSELDLAARTVLQENINALNLINQVE